MRLTSADARVAVPVALLLAFAALVGLRLHGFSIAAWHAVIDGSPPDEVLFGTPRLIRSDDWKVHLPLALSQAAHRPAFPVENDLIGLGQSAWLPLELPVAHPLGLFRPLTWGFFLGPDVGMAWMWWGRVLGLFGIWFGVLRALADGRSGLAALGACAVVAAPFFQFWSFNAAFHAAAAGAAFLAARSLVHARGPVGILASAAALAFAGACFVLAVYPPYQVTLAWLIVALSLGFALAERHTARGRSHAWLRGLAALGAVLFVLAVTAAFVAAAGDAIEALRQTAYPGRRFSTGGGRTLAQLANATLAAGLWAERWGPFYNVCEAASFWLLAPAPAALWCVRWLRGERVDPVAAALLVYLLAVLLYAVVGVPSWLARATGFGLVPGPRAVIGIGLADTALLVRWLACAEPLRAGERTLGLVLATGWALALVAAAAGLIRELPDAQWRVLLPLAAANGGLAWIALAARRRALPLGALAALSLASAVWFHPVTQGGSRWLLDNELSRTIRALDREAGGDSVWASFGPDELANLFRMLGVDSINGALPIPQLALWRRIDPDGRGREAYNRYAHVALHFAPVSSPSFQLRSRDFVILRLDPGGPALRELGVTHVAFRGTPARRRAFEALAGFEPLGAVGHVFLYRVPGAR